MSLDYSAGCVNFRDVGECLNLLAGRAVLPVGRLLRGGKLEFVESAEAIGNPASIINLRKGVDPLEKHFGAQGWHFPISNDYEKYNTTDRVVRRWLNEVLECVANEVTALPVLFHCTSGKDRTGVVVACLLTLLGIEHELIIQEYLWSEGEVKREWIEGSLNGLGDVQEYFRKVDVKKLKTNFF